MILPLSQKRRSIRKYQKRPIESDKVQALVEAALVSPSSMAARSWEFVVVDDPDLLDKLSKAKPQGSAFIKNAPLGILVCVGGQALNYQLQQVPYLALLLAVLAHLPTVVDAERNPTVGVPEK